MRTPEQTPPDIFRHITHHNYDNVISTIPPQKPDLTDRTIRICLQPKKEFNSPLAYIELRASVGSVLLVHNANTLSNDSGEKLGY